MRMFRALVGVLCAQAMLVGHAAPKNVIVMIGDGFGPAAVSLGRVMKQENLVFDPYLVGTIRTRSSDSLITDSAASATAYATGKKTYNGAISVDDNQNVLHTLLEAAQEKGMQTGLIVKSEISDATPASFSAHARVRSEKNNIAAQQANKKIDILLGGGNEHFLPENAGGSRTDNLNLLAHLKQQGYQQVKTRTALEKADSLPLVGLFSRSDMPYRIDLDTAQLPTLPIMAEKGLALLNKHNPNGFFLLIEGSLIDHAAHENDVSAQVHEILEFDKTIAVVETFVKNNPDTLVVITADHETGGLTLGRDGKKTWYPEVLTKIKHSREYLTDRLEAGDSLEAVIEASGFEDLSNHAISKMKQAIRQKQYAKAVDYLEREIHEAAQLAWSTDYHTGVDVNLYALGEDRTAFAGNIDNTELATTLARLMGVQLN